MKKKLEVLLQEDKNFAQKSSKIYRFVFNSFFLCIHSSIYITYYINPYISFCRIPAKTSVGNNDLRQALDIVLKNGPKKPSVSDKPPTPPPKPTQVRQESTQVRPESTQVRPELPPKPSQATFSYIRQPPSAPIKDDESSEAFLQPKPPTVRIVNPKILERIRQLESVMIEPPTKSLSPNGKIAVESTIKLDPVHERSSEDSIESKSSTLKSQGGDDRTLTLTEALEKIEVKDDRSASTSSDDVQVVEVQKRTKRPSFVRDIMDSVRSSKSRTPSNASLSSSTFYIAVGVADPETKEIETDDRRKSLETTFPVIPQNDSSAENSKDVTDGRKSSSAFGVGINPRTPVFPGVLRAPDKMGRRSHKHQKQEKTSKTGSSSAMSQIEVSPTRSEAMLKTNSKNSVTDSEISCRFCDRKLLQLDSGYCDCKRSIISNHSDASTSNASQPSSIYSSESESSEIVQYNEPPTPTDESEEAKRERRRRKLHHVAQEFSTTETKYVQDLVCESLLECFG